MTIGKLSRLFSTLGKPANNQDTARLAKAAEVALQQPAADAVNVRISKETATQSTADSSDPEKVARLKKQVAEGSYKVDSTKVATAFMNELGLS